MNEFILQCVGCGTKYHTQTIGIGRIRQHPKLNHKKRNPKLADCKGLVQKETGAK